MKARNIYRLIVTREFTGGNLAGITIDEDKVCDFPSEELAQNCAHAINRKWADGLLDYHFTTYRIEMVK